MTHLNRCKVLERGDISILKDISKNMNYHLRRLTEFTLWLQPKLLKLIDNLMEVMSPAHIITSLSCGTLACEMP